MSKHIQFASELADYQIGDKVDLLFGELVIVKEGFVGRQFMGRIVGKSGDGIPQHQIVECMDGTYPSDTYRYTTVSVPASLLMENTPENQK